MLGSPFLFSLTLLEVQFRDSPWMIFRLSRFKCRGFCGSFASCIEDISGSPVTSSRYNPERVPRKGFVIAYDCSRVLVQVQQTVWYNVPGSVTPVANDGPQWRFSCALFAIRSRWSGSILPAWSGHSHAAVFIRQTRRAYSCTPLRLRDQYRVTLFISACGVDRFHRIRGIIFRRRYGPRTFIHKEHSITLRGIVPTCR